MKKKLGAILLVVAVVVIALGIWRPWEGHGTSGDPYAGKSLTTVRGVIGSEKRDFFNDSRVQQVFADHGLKVDVSTAGSREIATTTDLSELDFAFPSSAPAAQKIIEKTGAHNTYDPFSSPMVVFTWKPVADLLQRNGVMSTASDGSLQLDVEAYLGLVAKDARWRDLDGAAELYNSPRSVMIGSTDIRTSNSAAMYMDIVSYQLNGASVVTADDQLTKITPTLRRLFVGQGYSASSSDEPFKDYLTQGVGSKPMVVGYEAQYVGTRVNTPDAVPQEAVMAYLSPTVYSKHVVVPLTDEGDQIGRLLAEDGTLRSLAVEHGFRTDGSGLADLARDRGIPGVQRDIINVADTPSFDMTERMIAAIEEGYK
ncbi:hypothetical protein [Pseudoclavibacter sp. CFCC 13611]|uniref:hypothetical protein n=1 Tax=Pseudoclavibacter sp. CFCC 13611 TaxID=2615178 RepID=UPI0013013086|nr:hypothetical protein [Pseudoclavibacter sp. CFCC 13611]KAB1662645.1 hypothetical protein F8O08_08645 [Pseudoclavibacter sp. CFCC 13611]